MDQPIALVDVPDMVGISYRQADFWTRTDLIKSHLVSRTTGNEVHPKFKARGWEGTGMMRVLDDGELDVIKLMADLVHAGMLARQAATLARRLLDEPLGEITVGTLLLSYRPEQVPA